MKFKLILFLICVLISSNVHSQEGAVRIKYLLNFQIDSTNTESANTEVMYLDILEKQKSYFQSESTYLKDSILLSNNPHALFGISKPKFKYSIVKSANNKECEVFHDYTAYKYKVKDSVKLIWSIDNDSTKIILGQKCKFATTEFRGRMYNAWFAVKLSNSNGPYKFSGLPGLILEVYDTKKHYHFEAFSIEQIEDYTTYLNSADYTEINKVQFKEFEQKIKEKPSLILYNPGIQIPKEGLDKYDRNHRERNKYKNNPIELTGK